MADELSLDGFLADLCQEGVRVDSGRFEVDAEAALRKLERFSYAEPTTFFFPLLAASTGLGAKTLEVQLRPREAIWHYRCPVIEQEILDQLFRFAFDDRRRGLRHLALGVLGASRQPGVRLEIASGSQRGLFSDPEFRWSPCPEPVEGIRLRIFRSGWAARWGLGPPLERPPDLKVQSFLRSSPTLVYWGSQVLGDSAPPRARVVQTFSGVYQATLGLGAESPGLHWVVDGMTFSEDPQLLGFPGTVAVLSGNWKIDISYQRLIRDETYQRVLEEVRQRLEEMVMGLRPLLIPEQERLDLCQHLTARWKVSGQEKALRNLYLEAIEAMERWGEELEFYHPLLLAACLYFREASPQADLRRRASRLLCGASLSMAYAQSRSWEEVRDLSSDVFGMKTPRYRRFLLHCLVSGAIATREAAKLREALLEALPRQGDIPEVEIERWDPALANLLPSEGSYEKQMEFLSAVRRLVSPKFMHLHSRLDRIEQQADFEMRANRYKGRAT